MDTLNVTFINTPEDESFHKSIGKSTYHNQAFFKNPKSLIIDPRYTNFTISSTTKKKKEIHNFIISFTTHPMHLL